MPPASILEFRFETLVVKRAAKRMNVEAGSVQSE